MLSAVPPLICNPDLTEEFVSAMKTLCQSTLNGYPDINAPASEDFASLQTKFQVRICILSAGFEDERGDYPVHHQRLCLMRTCARLGAACYAQCAEAFLKKPRGRFNPSVFLIRTEIQNNARSERTNF